DSIPKRQPPSRRRYGAPRRTAAVQDLADVWSGLGQIIAGCRSSVAAYETCAVQGRRLPAEGRGSSLLWEHSIFKRGSDESCISLTASLLRLTEPRSGDEKLKFTLKNVFLPGNGVIQCGVRNAECGMGSWGNGRVYW